MNIMMIGDIVGKGGRQAIKELVPELRRKYNVSFCIANAENVAAGAGLSVKCLQDMSEVVDVFTSGDHTWDQKGFDSEIAAFDRIIRPANFHKNQPGRGVGIFRNPLGGDVVVISLMGQVFMRDCASCPFEKIDEVLANLPKGIKNIFVDFHGEATSEKIAMGRYLDGRVTAVVGTHTHVQTADAEVFPGGTAYISDLGMTGAAYSVLGREVKDVIFKFTTGMPCRLNVVEKGRMRIDGVVINYDGISGRAREITNFSHYFEV
ncbi:MAG: YmdB family metallophosphoesterase [Lentisphaeria bacterium]|nr:YmdB family metallophosphoesterase [Lentisphaeria bacterium]